MVCLKITRFKGSERVGSLSLSGVSVPYHFDSWMNSGEGVFLSTSNLSDQGVGLS